MKRWLCAVLLFVAGLCGCQPTVIGTTLQVHMLSVGDADCFLLQQGTASMLVDAGLPENGDRIVSYIAKLGIDRLDYVMLTHPHADHMGGMAAVFDSFEVGEYLYSQAPTALVQRTVLHDRLEEAVAENGAVVTDVTNGATWSLGKATVTVYPVEGEYDDLNDYSIVCMVEFVGKRLLLTGDVTTARLESLVSHSYDLTADVMKLPHHGSDHSYCKEFLDAVLPQYALISCRVDNAEGHPGKKSIAALKAMNATVYRTDLHNTVVLTMRSEGIFVESAR